MYIMFHYPSSPLVAECVYVYTIFRPKQVHHYQEGGERGERGERGGKLKRRG